VFHEFRSHRIIKDIVECVNKLFLCLDNYRIVPLFPESSTYSHFSIVGFCENAVYPLNNSRERGVFPWPNEEMEVISHDIKGFNGKRILLFASLYDIIEDFNDDNIGKNDFIPIDFANYMVRCALFQMSFSISHTICMASISFLL
jgi:hypothetical protein